VAKQECLDVQRGNYEDEEGAHARLLAGTFGGVRIVNVYIPNGQSVGSEKFHFKLDWMKRLRGFFDKNTPDALVIFATSMLRRGSRVNNAALAERSWPVDV
jgi:exonuclease III